MFVCPIQWNPDSAPSSNVSTATPPGCPPDAQYVPRLQHTQFVHSAHSSLGTGHPGANAILSLLKDCYWWPNMARDVRRFVQGCEECAISKSPRHLPAGKLLPLPVPNRSWSHLGVDFITDLPVSEGNTCVLVVVDRFSKSCRLIPLKNLPTAMETAEQMFNHSFRYFGIPKDIVSDRGPQFISSVWKNFLKLLVVTVSLSSGYHPQTNGQTERKIQEIGCFLRTFCHAYWLGRVRPELTSSTNHWTHSLPVHAVWETYRRAVWTTKRTSLASVLLRDEESDALHKINDYIYKDTEWKYFGC